MTRLERMYQYPASFKEALIHKNANKFGYSSSRMNDSSDTPICPCCENYVNTVSIPVMYRTLPNRNPKSSEPVFMLPSNTSLYFTILKMIIGYLLMRFFILDLYNLVTTFSDRHCTLIAGKHSRL